MISILALVVSIGAITTGSLVYDLQLSNDDVIENKSDRMAYGEENNNDPTGNFGRTDDYIQFYSHPNAGWSWVTSNVRGDEYVMMLDAPNGDLHLTGNILSDGDICIGNC